MTRVLMVCLGNICRSPLAEGILRSKVTSKNIFVDSAGTASYHIGKAPDPRSIAVAKKYGIDISQQQCRQFSVLDFDRFDCVFVMDQSNYSDIVAKARTQTDKEKVKLLLNEIDLPINEVPDPYYGGEDGFEEVFAMIASACEKIAQKLN